jgi:hypothetical protein
MARRLPQFADDHAGAGAGTGGFSEPTAGAAVASDRSQKLKIVVDLRGGKKPANHYPLSTFHNLTVLIDYCFRIKTNLIGAVLTFGN